MKDGSLVLRSSSFLQAYCSKNIGCDEEKDPQGRTSREREEEREVGRKGRVDGEGICKKRRAWI